MSDRAEQARAEAERRWKKGDDRASDFQHKVGCIKGFTQGVEWADENQTVTPQALVVAHEEGLRDAHEMFNITRSISKPELEDAGAELWSLNDGGTLESWTDQASAAFRAAGIEVSDE